MQHECKKTLSYLLCRTYVLRKICDAFVKRCPDNNEDLLGSDVDLKESFVDLTDPFVDLSEKCV